eukprot:6485252-Amphidinium_carterae.1
MSVLCCLMRTRIDGLGPIQGSFPSNRVVALKRDSERAGRVVGTVALRLQRQCIGSYLTSSCCAW